jgi:acyl transferase domain-containing protein
VNSQVEPLVGAHRKTAVPPWKGDIIVPNPAFSAPILPSSDESVAVTGVSCRLPQAAGPEAFWQSLRQGGSAIVERPADREDKASGAGDWHSERGGFLSRVDEFDAEFFGISPEEASAMDPQQRLALELA